MSRARRIAARLAVTIGLLAAVTLVALLAAAPSLGAMISTHNSGCTTRYVVGANDQRKYAGCLWPRLPWWRP